MSTSHMINSLVEKFDKLGTLQNAPKIRTTVLEKTSEAKNLIGETIQERPYLSIRKIIQVSKTSYTLTRNILKEDLALKSYKYCVRQRLLEPDKEKLVNFASWFLKLTKYSCDYIICTDEAWFTLTPALNSQNNRIRSSKKPANIVEKPLHDQKIMAFCAISVKKNYGVYFLKTM